MQISQKKQKGQKSRSAKNGWRTNIFIILMLAYPLLQFSIFWLYANLDTVKLTFSRVDPETGEYVLWGVQRYKTVFENMILGKDVAARTMFWNSFRAIIINFIILPMAVVTAYCFYKKVPGERVFRVLFYMPSMISLVVLTMVYTYMFSAKFGPIASILNFITGKDVEYLSQRNDYLWTLIYIFCVWAGLGSNVILMCGAMQRIPREVTESLELDGAGFWCELCVFVVPLILTAIMTPASFYMQPMLIAQTPGEDNKYMTIAWNIFQGASGGSQRSILQTATEGVVFSTINTPIIIITKIIMDKLTPDVSY